MLEDLVPGEKSLPGLLTATLMHRYMAKGGNKGKRDGEREGGRGKERDIWCLFLFYKDTSSINKGSTFMNSYNLNHLFKTLFPIQSY